MIGSKEVMGIGKASIFLGWSINGKIIFDGMFVNIGRSIMGKEMGTRKLSLIVGKDDEKKASCYFLVTLNFHEHNFLKHPLKN